MDLLRKLSDAPGVSGFEDEVQKIVWDELAPYVDEIRRDRMGNVIGLKRARDRSGRVPKLVYAAHVDEIGLMVSHIDDHGFVRFRVVGGFDPRTLVSQRVVVHGTRAGAVRLNGVIAPQTGWLLSDEDRKRVFPVEELYIDLGRSAADVRSQVHIGDIVTLGARFEELSDDVVVGRNFDDRVGVYSLLEAMKRIEDPKVDVYAVSSVQEEVGVRGMPVAAHAIAADIGVAIDGSLASDVPYARSEQRQAILGEGTGIYLIDNRTIGSPRLVRFLLELGERRGIPVQRNLGGGTDASEIQRNGLGALATTIGAPTRYMHSTVQLCHRIDLEATTALLAAFAEEAHTLLPNDWI
jgi:endoglucanase